jgi:hypothetical protein
MFVAGIDVHATCSVIAIVSNSGRLVHKLFGIPNTGSSGELHRRCTSFLSIRRPPHSLWVDSRRCQPLAQGAFVRAVVTHITYAPDSWLSRSYSVFPLTAQRADQAIAQNDSALVQKTRGRALGS